MGKQLNFVFYNFFHYKSVCFLFNASTFISFISCCLSLSYIHPRRAGRWSWPGGRRQCDFARRGGSLNANDRGPVRKGLSARRTDQGAAKCDLGVRSRLRITSAVSTRKEEGSKYGGGALPEEHAGDCPFSSVRFCASREGRLSRTRKLSKDRWPTVPGAGIGQANRSGDTFHFSRLFSGPA